MIRSATVILTVVWTVAAFALAAGAEPPIPGGVFFDDDGGIHEGAIDAIARAGITVGCNESGSYFCPDAAVSRYEVATFLMRALDLDPSAPRRFGDVAGPHAMSVGAVEVAGLVAGCDPPANTRYCGDLPVTRAQMATLLVRAFDIPASTDDAFGDDDGSVHEANIDALAATGITKGCTADSYCPEDAVTRAQMASFLARSLKLPTPRPPDPFDGRLIFGSPGASAGLFEIWALDGSREPERILEGWMAAPRLSPDGQMIAFIDIEGSCGINVNWRECPWRLFIAGFGGENPRQLTPNELRVVANGWSGDGRRVWFAVEDQDALGLWWADVASGGLLRVASIAGASYATWSDDGHAAVHTEDDAIVVVGPDGAVEATITGPDGIGVTAWSPRGALAYVEIGAPLDHIIVLDRADASRTVVASLAYVTHLAWSADGGRLASLSYDGQAERLTIVDVVTAEAAGFALPDSAAGSLVWSPDGANLALVRGTDTRDDRLIRQVWSVRVSDGVMWPLAPPEMWAFEIDWR